jgi:hypothetical protein
MKFIKSISEFINEAFESSGISKTLSFIKTKCGTDNTDKFLSSLRKILENFDYPISKLNDRHIKYMPAKSAILLKSPTDVELITEVYALKFWFSLETGFLGYTGIGNQTFPYKSTVSSSTSEFTESEIEYLKRNISSKLPRNNYTNGKLIPVRSSEYEKLKTGDVVAGYFNSYEEYTDLTWATIWLENGKIFAIQDVSDGSYPEEGNWRQYGDSSWVIFLDGSPEDDHIKLHKYVPPSSSFTSDKNQDVEDPLTWNLPLRNSELKSWSSSYNSIRNEEKIKDADFCLVIYLDDMMNPDKAEFFERPSDIRKERNRDRLGATALMSDDEIKSVNLSRYISELVSRMGISIESTEFKDLQKLLLKSLCGDFSLQCVFKMSFSRLNSFHDTIYDMIQQISSEDKEYYFERIISQHKNNLKYYNNILENFKQTEKLIFSDEIDDFLEEKEKELFLKQYEKCKQLSILILSYFENSKIETIEDLKIAIWKLETLSSMFREDRTFKLNSRFLNILMEFDDPMEVEHNLNRITYDGLQQNEVKLNNIERAIKSFLR